MIEPQPCPSCNTVGCTYQWCPAAAKRMWSGLAEQARALGNDFAADTGTSDDAASDLHRRYASLVDGMQDRRFEMSRRLEPWVGEDIRILAQYKAWSARRHAYVLAEQQREKDERLTAARKRWRPIECSGVDITEHVAAMFDAIVSSLDWGSDFLEDDTIASILIVAEAAGFEAPDERRESIVAALAKWRTQNAARVAAESQEV